MYARSGVASGYTTPGQQQGHMTPGQQQGYMTPGQQNQGYMTPQLVMQPPQVLLLTLGLELSDTKSLRALNTSPPRNYFSLLRSSCSSKRVLYLAVQLSI